MALNNEIIRQKLIEKFGDAITDWDEPYGMLTFTSRKEPESESAAVSL